MGELFPVAADGEKQQSMATPSPISEQTLMVYCAMSRTSESPETTATPPTTASAPTATGSTAATRVWKTSNRTRIASGSEMTSALSRSCSRVWLRSLMYGSLPVQVMVNPPELRSDRMRG